MGPWIDGACAGGISIAAYAFYRFHQTGYARIQVSDTALALALYLGWGLSKPHLTATIYRLYQSEHTARRHFFSAVIFPFLLAGLAAAAFTYPASVAPLLVKLVLLWAPLHFSGQNFGLTLLYAKRAELGVSRAGRWLLLSFLHVSVLAQYAESESYKGTMDFLGITYPLWGIPSWIGSSAKMAAFGMGAALVAASLAWMARNRRPIPWIVAVPCVAHFLWMLAGAKLASFQILVPGFHALQFAMVAWAAEIHQQAGENPLRTSRRLFLWTRSARWAALNLGGSAALFFLLPQALGSIGYDQAFCGAMILVMFQLHHYFVDGVLWKLRREGERSPLFTHYSRAFG